MMKRPRTLCALKHKLLEGNYEKARSILLRLSSTSDCTSQATQRIAYWFNGSLNSGYSPHPMRILNVVDAAQTNF